MGRWTEMDEDEQRLPEGIERVGYDTDTQRYTFRSKDGALYESAPGCRYGELNPVGHQYSPEELEEQNHAVERGNSEALRMMLPFALLVLVFMFLVLKIVVDCRQGSHQVETEKT